MTCETTITGADAATAADLDLPPAPRSWPHIARRERTPDTGEHPTRPLPVWPRRTTEQPTGRRDIYRGRGARRCTGRAGNADAASATISPGHSAHPTGERSTGRHRAVSTARSAERAVSAPSYPAGPSDLERRARRYERRMTNRVDACPRSDRAPGSPDPGPARCSQRTTPARPTRFPAVQPGRPAFPGTTPVRHAPDRHLRRSPGRNPIRRPEVDNRRVSGTGLQRRAGRQGAAVARRRLDTLIGTALTTALIAIPLGPGSTAAASTGESAAWAAHSGSEIGRAARAISVPARARTAHAESAVSGSSLDRVPGPKSTTGAIAGVSTPDTAVADPAVPSVEASSGPPDSGTTATAGESSSTDVVVGSPTGSSRGGGCGTGSNSGSVTGSGPLCREIPLLRNLVRELMRLAPRPIPPCPCPGRAR